jgi:hypothetical protein
MQCKKSFALNRLFEVLYCAEGIYFFCSKECSDKWTSTVAQQKESGKQQQPAKVNALM